MVNVRVDIPELDVRPDVVRQALAGRLPTVSPSVALALISNPNISRTDQQTLLHEAVQDASLGYAVRAAAVRVYMRQGTEIAGPDLLKALESPEERVAAAAALALGQAGTADHLPALERMTKGGEFLKRRVAFAKALIIHRFGLADKEVELPTAEGQQAPAPGALAFASVRPGTDRKARALEGIKREFPSLETGKQDVYELQCGPRLMEVAIDRGFLGSDWPERAKRPGLPAIVAVQRLEYDEFYPRFVVLSRPAGKDRVSLQITTLSGDLVYFGEGSVSRTSSEFELQSAQRPGITPVAARLHLTAKGLHISGVSDRRALPGQGPNKM